MIWNDELQSRLDDLRAREFSGELTDEDRSELDRLVAALDNEEAERLAPLMEQSRQRQAGLSDQLRSHQAGNEELAQLIQQQEQLVTDTRRWLAQFDRRHQLIQRDYTRLVGQSVASSIAP